MKQQRVTIGELAQHLNINTRHVKRMVRAGMPTSSIAAAQRWRERNISGRANGGEGLNELRGSLIEARRRLADLEYRERMRDLIPAKDVERLLVDIGQVLRTQLLQVPAHIRGSHPQLDAAVFADLKKLHHRALQVMADALKELAGEGRAATQ